MPGLDRQGPMGAGPMTGGRRGLCANTVSRFDSPVSVGLGYGRGLGLGRGFRGGFGPGRGRGAGGRFAGRFAESPRFYDEAYPPGPTSEMDMLKAEANAIQETLAGVLKRITELETEKQNIQE
jgi:uncharacterized protein DUF5320